MKHLFRTLTLFVLVFISTSAFSQDTVMLKYGMKEGSKFLQETEVRQNTVQSMMGQEIKVLGEIKATSEFDVEAVSAEGNMTVLMKVKDISIRTQAMGRDTTMRIEDSKDAARIVFSPEGKVITSAKVDSSEAAAVINQLDQGRMKMLPGKMVKTGETWVEDFTDTKNSAAGTPFALETTTHTEFTLVGKEVREGRNCFRVTTSGTVAVTGKGSQMGMEMFIEGGGKTEGFFLFDPATAMVIYTEDVIEMEMSVAVSGPQNMTIPMTQTSKIITSVK